MFESERPARDTTQSLRDMERFCRRVLVCSAELDQAEFVRARDLYESSMWNLVLIGEAASNVPRTFQDENPQIPWGLIIAARNRFVHRFWRIDNDIVWDIVKVHVPNLLDALREILGTIDQERT